jgi:hypothetical protein
MKHFKFLWIGVKNSALVWLALYSWAVFKFVPNHYLAHAFIGALAFVSVSTVLLYLYRKGEDLAAAQTV